MKSDTQPRIRFTDLPYKQKISWMTKIAGRYLRDSSRRCYNQILINPFTWAHWNEIVKLWNVYLMLIFPEYRHKSEIWPFSLNMTKRGHFSPQCARFSAEPVKMKEKPRSRSLEEVASASKWRARQMKASASKCGIKRGQEKNKMEKRWLLKPNFRGTQPLKRTRRKMREVKYSNLWHHQLDFCSSFFII